jgi:hypothetical protein
MDDDIIYHRCAGCRRPRVAGDTHRGRVYPWTSRIHAVQVDALLIVALRVHWCEFL